MEPEFQLLGEPPKRKRTDYTGVIIGAIVAPVYVLFIFFGRGELGLSVSIVLGMVMLAIRVRWDLRKCLWFWAVIVLLLLLQTPLLFLVRWPHSWIPATAMLPVGLADVLIILGVVRFVEKFIVKAPPSETA